MRVRYFYRGFGAVALTPEAATAYNDAMNRVATPVTDAIEDLRDAVSGYSWTKLIFLGPMMGTVMQAPEETRRAISSGINTMSTRMRQLEVSRGDVLGGRLALNKWVGAVTAVFDGVKALAQQLDESTILSLATAQVNQAARDAAEVYERFKGALIEVGSKAGKGLEYGLPLLGVAAILLAVFVGPKLLSGGTTVIVRDRT